MLNLNKYQAMYVQKDEKARVWYVCRIEADGYISVPKVTFKTKKEAIAYIKSYGLKPSKPPF